MNDTDLDSYYQYVLDAGRLRTPAHAKRWSNGVLKTLGICLDRRTKRALTKSLPRELAEPLNGVFWLLHFRDPRMTSEEFRQRAARRSGNSNAEFALYPTLAVFGGLKRFVGPGLDRRVAKSLAPEVGELWKAANVAPPTRHHGYSQPR